MTRNETKERVLSTLVMYDHVPIKTDPICAYLNIKERELQHAIQELRQEGCAICSGDGGYWIWDGKDDSLKRTIAQLKSRIKNQSATITALERIPLDGQQMLEIGGN